MSLESPADFKNGIDSRMKRLNESLKSLKIIEITFADASKFKENVMNDIINEFYLTLDKISREGDVFVAKIEEKNLYLAHTANFYDII